MGTSKRFLRNRYSNEEVKKVVFFTPLNEWSPKRGTFEMLESSILKIFSSPLWSLLRSVSLSFEKLGQ